MTIRAEKTLQKRFHNLALALESHDGYAEEEAVTIVKGMQMAAYHSDNGELQDMIYEFVLRFPLHFKLDAKNNIAYKFGGA